MATSNPSQDSSSIDNQPKKLRSDFIFLKTIGEGSFSIVHLAEDKKTGLKFAIKECDKHQIVKEKKVKYIHLEKRILAQYLTNHPFIVKLCFTFQDESSLYFGLTYCSNGDLLEYIKKYEFYFKNKNFTHFYSAEIVDAIEFMHSKSVIHRDLKPENILIDDRRHIKITDFGTARILDDTQVPATANDAKQIEMKMKQINLYETDNPTVEDDEDGRSKAEKTEARLKRRSSFVGTAQYVAPEILKGKDVHNGCDLWALGCIIYQMFTGKHCFTGSHEYDIYQKIIRVSYQLPDTIPSTGKALIQALIQYEPSKRLGVEEQGGFEKLKKHEFFDNISWLNLNEQEPPTATEAVPPTTTTTPTDESNTTILLNSKQLANTAVNSQYVFTNQLIEILNTNSEYYTNADLLRQFHFLNVLTLLHLTKSERENMLKRQERENKYHRFVRNNLILKQGFLLKRKDMRSRRRMFLLTEGPNLFYVKEEDMVMKGSIPWSKELRCEIKNFQVFYIHTPKRKYYLIDEESCTLEWCKAIMDVKYFYYDQ